MANKSRLNKRIDIMQFFKGDLVWRTILWIGKILKKNMEGKELRKRINQSIINMGNKKYK